MTRKPLVLATVCLAALTINLDTTIVNVALPSLARELDAGTRDLLWIVDGYNLAFAALVLAMGSLSDKFGRRPALLAGLAGFARQQRRRRAGRQHRGADRAALRDGHQRGADLPDDAVDHLQRVHRAPRARRRPRPVGRRDRHRRRARSGRRRLAARALLLAQRLLGAGAGRRAHDRDGAGLRARVARPRQCRASTCAGLVVSVGRPRHADLDDHRGARPRLEQRAPRSPGSPSPSLLVAVFVRSSGRSSTRCSTSRLFPDRRFSAACGAVTIAFFALFGFIFLITQYFQFVRDYSALGTGPRILPVATCIAVASVAGGLLAPRVGTKAVVTTGLALLGSLVPVDLDVEVDDVLRHDDRAADGPDGPRPRPGLDARHRVDPAGAAAGPRRRRLGGQRRHPRARRHPRRRRDRLALLLAVRRQARRRSCEGQLDPATLRAAEDSVGFADALGARCPASPRRCSRLHGRPSRRVPGDRPALPGRRRCRAWSPCRGAATPGRGSWPGVERAARPSEISPGH